MIISSLTTALLAAPAPTHTSNSGGGDTSLWIVVPIMLIAVGAMIVRALRRRR